MSLHLRIGTSAAGALASLLILCLPARSTSAQTNAVENLTNQTAAATAALLEGMIQLQAQQKATLQELELARHEIASSLTSSFSNNMAHLNAMSEMLARQRALDMKILRDSNRLVLAILVGLIGLLLLSIIFLNVTSIRALNRLATVFQASALVATTGEGLPTDASRQLLLLPGEEGQRQLGSALLQLQTRVQTLEHDVVKSHGSAAPPAK